MEILMNIYVRNVQHFTCNFTPVCNRHTQNLLLWFPHAQLIFLSFDSPKTLPTKVSFEGITFRKEFVISTSSNQKLLCICMNHSRVMRVAFNMTFCCWETFSISLFVISEALIDRQHHFSDTFHNNRNNTKKVLAFWLPAAIHPTRLRFLLGFAEVATNRYLPTKQMKT